MAELGGCGVLEVPLMGLPPIKAFHRSGIDSFGLSDDPSAVVYSILVIKILCKSRNLVPDLEFLTQPSNINQQATLTALPRLNFVFLVDKLVTM